ncbi:hypothetical protein JXJ21_24600 [candidate division KSB1 bacterium]|nr:hypothetical protein [candidate division KSB1 bacterium]
MAKVIIGIHGLGNKPPRRILKRWWKKSIREGLTAISQPRFFIKFDFVYWSDLLYPKPLNPRIKDEKNPLYLDDPYTRGKDFQKKSPSKIRKKILDYLRKQLDNIFLNDDKSLNFSSISDLIIHSFFKELELYYSSTCIGKKGAGCLVRDVMRERLRTTLKKYQKDEILLIAHSMGSIIAYDVLRFSDDDIKVDYFVTIGSPLGLPIVVSRIASEQNRSLKKEDKIQTPEAVLRQWYNFSDLEDKVAIDYSLAGDYEPNSHHIGVKDMLVYNNYEKNGERNPHKSYGYLRTKELAAVIHDFLGGGKSTFLGAFIKKFKNYRAEN